MNHPSCFQQASMGNGASLPDSAFPILCFDLLFYLQLCHIWHKIFLSSLRAVCVAVKLHVDHSVAWPPCVVVPKCWDGKVMAPLWEVISEREEAICTLRSAFIFMCS